MSDPSPSSGSGRPSNPASPRRTWIYVLAGLIPALALLGLWVFVMSHALRDMGKADGGQKVTELCMKRLRQVAQAQFLYTADYDDQLPPAEQWVTASWTYGSEKNPTEVNESIFRCPTISMRREDGFGYAFNLDLDGKSLAEIPDRAGTPLVFDSQETFLNAAGSPDSSYPSPEGRHDGGTRTNIVNADGRTRFISVGSERKN